MNEIEFSRASRQCQFHICVVLMGKSCLPVAIIFSRLRLERPSIWILLISHFQTSNPLNRAGLERQIVFRLWIRVDVLDNHINSFSGITLFKIDVAHEIGVFEDLWWFKIAWQYLFR